MVQPYGMDPGVLPPPPMYTQAPAPHKAPSSGGASQFQRLPGGVAGATLPAATAGVEKRAEDKEPPVVVLGCPDCSFLCTSNNQMCRHMFLTCHGLHQCTQCTARLICWAFAPGVQKLFVRAKKDGVLVEAPVFETAEKHQERTGHVNLHIPGKDRYVKPGVPEDYGLTITRTPAVEPTINSRYCCPDCQKAITTWTQMTKHLDNTKHSLCRCAECDVPVKCYGMSQPLRHEKLTGHRGLIGIFRMKPDYLLTARGIPAVKQFGCQDCGVGFLHPLHIMSHLSEKHRITFPPTKCAECGYAHASLSEMCQHRLSSGHESFTYQDGAAIDVEHYALTLPEPAPVLESINSGQSRILYQCPTCFFVGTTWNRFERHLYATKHTLSFCSQCNSFVPPKVNSNDVEHRITAAHTGVFGEQLARTDYEVLLDVGNEDHCELIHSGLQASGPIVDGRVVYQCPLDDCRAIFPDSGALERHFTATRHGLIQCKCCDAEFSIVQEQWRTHDFEPEEVPPCVLTMQRTDDDCRVWVEDSTLLKYYGELFTECPSCKFVVEKLKLPSHQGSPRCNANRVRTQIAEKAGGRSAPEEACVGGVIPVHYQQPVADQVRMHSVASAPTSMYANPPSLPEYSAQPRSFGELPQAPPGFAYIHPGSSTPILLQSTHPGNVQAPQTVTLANPPSFQHSQGPVYLFHSQPR